MLKVLLNPKIYTQKCRVDNISPIIKNVKQSNVFNCHTSNIFNGITVHVYTFFFESCGWYKKSSDNPSRETLSSELLHCLTFFFFFKAPLVV